MIKNFLTFIFVTFLVTSCNFENSEEEAGGGLFHNNKKVEDQFELFVPTDKIYRTGDVLTFSLKHPIEIDVTGIPQLELTIGSDTRYADYTSGTGTSNLIFTYTITAGDEDLDGIIVSKTINLNAGSLQFTIGGIAQDATAEIATAPSTSKIKVDSTGPAIVLVTPPIPKTYYYHDTLSFLVNFDHEAYVTGTPQIEIDINGTTAYANYQSGSGSANHTYTYQIKKADIALSGLSISSPLKLNGGTITDLSSNTATLTFTPIPMPTTHVNGAAPLVDSITLPSSGNYYKGGLIAFDLVFNEAVSVAAGIPTIDIDISGNTVAANYISGSGTSILTFNYIIEETDVDLNGLTIGNSVSLNGATIKNAAAIDAKLSIAPPLTPGVIVDGALPEITDLILPADKEYVTGENLDFTVIFSKNVNVTNTPKLVLQLNSELAEANYLGGSGSKNLIFRFTPIASESDNNGIAFFNNTLDLNSTGTIKDSASQLNAKLDFSALAPFNMSGIKVNDNPPTQLTINTAPVNTHNGFTIPNIVIEIRDAQNNIVTNATNSVTLAFGTDPSAGSANISGTQTVAAVAGIATFNDISIDTVNSGYTFTFSATGLTGATSSSFDITQAPATQLAFVSQPSNAVAGVAINPVITVEFRDANNNLVPNNTDNITLSLGADPSSSAATLSGTLTVAAIGGVATFNDLSLDKAFAGYDLLASSAALTTDTSSAFTITPATKAKLAFTTGPTNTEYNSSIAPAITVEIRDQYDNKTADTDAISIVINNNPGGASLSGTATVNAIAGIASFSDLSLDAVGSSYTLDATAAGLTVATSAAFDIIAGVPTQIVITQEPSHAYPATNISPAITVELRDAGNNLCTSATNLITVAISTDPSGSTATLSGTTSVAAVGGMANFTNLNINKAFTGYAITFSSAGLTSAVSANFNITPPTISSVTVPTSATYTNTNDLTFTAITTQAINVTGIPQIQLNIGGVTRYADYDAASSTTTSHAFTYTVQAADNDLNGIQHLSPISLNAGSMNDTHGNALTLTFTAADTSGVIVSNATPGVTVTPITGPVFETGTSETFTVVLDAQPTADVTVPISSLDTTEGTVNVSSLIFTTSNWDTPQTVTVTGVDDSILDGNKIFELEIGTITSADANYNGINVANIFATCIDATTTPGITLTAISGNTSEEGGTATFNIVLDSEPTDNVSIGLTSNNTAEGTVSPGTVVFTNTNWATPQLVTITGVDDLLEDGDQTYTIITAPASSVDPSYSNIDAPNMSVINEDNDSIGISVSAVTGSVNEGGGTASFGIRLKSAPSDDVTMNISTSDASEGTITAGPTLTFTTANWNVVQTIVVTGQDDIFADGDQVFYIIIGASSSTDPAYNAIDPPDVSLTNSDDDSSGFLVSSVSGHTTESGGQATFTLKLTSQPTDDVSINLSSSKPTEGTISPTSLTFTSSDWSTPQTVTITGQDDAVEDGNQHYEIITSAATSTDPAYSGFDPYNILLSNIDDDSIGISVTPTSGLTTSETGSQANFSIVLLSAPADDVTIPITSLDTTEGTVGPASVTFTSSDWAIPKNIVVTGVDDAVQDGSILYTIDIGASSSTDPNYDAIDPTNVIITNSDDDSIGISVSFANSSGSRYELLESGTTLEIQVKLKSPPTSNVLITYYEEDTAEAIATPSSGLTFTPLNWNVPQTITVTGIDDAGAADGNDDWELIFYNSSSADANYNNLAINKIWFTTLDDDSAGVKVDPYTVISEIVVWETGTSETFMMRLSSPPTSNVTITMTSTDTGEGTVSPSTFTFTPENWNINQTGNITGVDDAGAADGTQTWQINSTASSADGSYDGIAIDPVIVKTIDDDSPGYFVTPDTTINNIKEVSENGSQLSFSVVLTSQPTDNVTLYPYSNDTTEAVIAESSLVFTPSNWNAPQIITVTGVDDVIIDGDKNINIMWNNTTSADGNYNGIEPGIIYLKCIDND